MSDRLCVQLTLPRAELAKINEKTKGDVDISLKSLKNQVETFKTKAIANRSAVIKLLDKKKDSTNMKHDVFLSYSHSDSERAFEIEARYVGSQPLPPCSLCPHVSHLLLCRLLKAGYTVWIDRHIRPGMEWRNEIAQAMENWRYRYSRAVDQRH